MIEGNSVLEELITLHDNGICICEGFSEERDTVMCLAQRYLGGSIDEKYLIEELKMFE